MHLRISRQPNYVNYLFTTGNSDRADGVLTTVTASGAVVASWLNHISSTDQRGLNHGIVSFNVKYHSTDRGVVTVLQLGLAGRCLLFQLCHTVHIPLSLRNFLANASFTFIGFGIYQEARKLFEDRRLLVGFKMDLGNLAADRMYGMRRRELHPIGLRELAGTLLRVSWNKPPMVETSDYSRSELTVDEVKYASLDSILTADLGRRFCLGSSYRVRDWVWSLVSVG